MEEEILLAKNPAVEHRNYHPPVPVEKTPNDQLGQRFWKLLKCENRNRYFTRRYMRIHLLDHGLGIVCTNVLERIPTPSLYDPKSQKHELCSTPEKTQEPRKAKACTIVEKPILLSCLLSPKFNNH